MFDVFYITKKPQRFPDAVQVQDRAEAQAKSRTRFCWLLDGYNEYNRFSSFDPLWEPTPWEANQVHVWPSECQAHGGTELIPVEWDNDVNYHSDEIDRKYFPKIVLIEHSNQYGRVQSHGVSITHHSTVGQSDRFVKDYLSTLKRIVNNHKDEPYLWIISTVCDYEEFDFMWHPSEWQDEMLHVFPSDDQKFGDTFYINVKHFLKQMKNLELLEWYDTICFQETVVPRHSPPTVYHDCDSTADGVKEHVFNSIADGMFQAPYAIFVAHPLNCCLILPKGVPTMNLWRPETRTITPLSPSGDVCVVPKDALGYIKDEMYEYPYIDNEFHMWYECQPLDIVFLSNGEDCAQENYDHLCKVTGQVVPRVDNVKGRLKAYQACAMAANTSWFFIVYAKLKVDASFDWHWQPDKLQKPKHYIFDAYNPLTDDTYGHMAMIAFNKKLVLEHDGQGLDFSLHQEHEVVPILSGEAVYAGDPWAEWRTAFREVLKLKATKDISAEPRLDKWVTAKSKWTKQGALDAVQYYNEVNGSADKLRLSYEWDWLLEYYKKYITS